MKSKKKLNRFYQHYKYRDCEHKHTKKKTVFKSRNVNLIIFELHSLLFAVIQQLLKYN